MRAQRSPLMIAGLVLGLLLLALMLRPPAEPAVTAASLAGCGAHTTYLTACSIQDGSIDDALPTGNAVNYYSISVPAEGKAIQVQLSGAASLHAALLRDESGVAGAALSDLSAAQPQEAVGNAGPTVPGQNVSGAPPQEAIGPYPAPFESTPFESTPFESTPFESTPFESTDTGSRGMFPLQVVGIAGDATATKTLTHFTDALDAPEARKATLKLAVWSPAGVTSSYSLTLSTLAAADTCQPDPNIVPALPSGFAQTHGANPQAPNGVQTVILTNEERWARYYGTDGQARVMQELDTLAQQQSVNGVVINVAADNTVASAYAAWNANQCSATLANAVAARIKALLAGYISAHPSVHYVVVAGGDDIMPFFRMPDPTQIADEQQYAGQNGLLANSAGSSSFARNDLLTDDYYTDPHGALSGPDILFTEAMPLGRLVESPDDITATIQSYIQQQGALHADTALVTGYDFLERTATDVGAAVSPALNNLSQLNSNSWGGAQLAEALGGTSPASAAYLQAGTSPDLVFFSGHFAHNALQTAQLDGFQASALLGVGGLSGKVLFTLGCHSGASISDPDTDPTQGIDPRDWAQTIEGLGGLLIGNTGYGYGDSDVPAYGQQLMTSLAQYLVSGSSDNPMPIGEALMLAKQLYHAENGGKWDAYHDKTLMEATLYGLPMYGIAVPYPQAIPSDPTMLQGTASSVGQDTVLHAEVDAPQTQRVDTSRGSYYASSGGLDERAFQPVQPEMTFALPEMQGMIPHSVAVTGATSQSVGNWDPVILRPMWDVTDPEPEFTYNTPVPSTLGSINAQTGGGAQPHNLVLTFGQFVSTGTVPAGDPNDPNNPYVANGMAYPHVVGNETLYSHLSIDIYYVPIGSDQRPPSVNASVVCDTNGNLQIQAQSTRTLTSLAALATVNGALQPMPLASSDGHSWSGAFPSGGAAYLQAIDSNGNVSEVPVTQPTSACVPNNPATATPTPPVSNTQTPPQQRPKGSVTITSATFAGFTVVGGTSGIETLGGISSVPLAVNLQGTWSTGGPRCDAPNATWLLDWYIAGPTGDPNSVSATPLPPSPAPCVSGLAVPWSTQVPLQNVLPFSTVCVALYFGQASSPPQADSFACTGIPQQTQPPPTRSPSPTPSPSPSPHPTPSPVATCPPGYNLVYVNNGPSCLQTPG
jgi:hypothetical protein